MNNNGGGTCNTADTSYMNSFDLKKIVIYVSDKAAANPKSCLN